MRVACRIVASSSGVNTHHSIFGISHRAYRPLCPILITIFEITAYSGWATPIRSVHQACCQTYSYHPDSILPLS